MKTFATLAFALSLLALAPLAHAETQTPGPNTSTTQTPGPNTNGSNSGSSITLLNPLNAGDRKSTRLNSSH